MCNLPKFLFWWYWTAVAIFHSHSQQYLPDTDLNSYFIKYKQSSQRSRRSLEDDPYSNLTPVSSPGSSLLSHSPLRTQLKENEIFENHKPVFKDCSKYNASVIEEHREHFVVQVQAVDQDPPDRGGTVSYQLIKGPGERSKFRIDKKTGEIFTTHAFDRDEPAREKVAYITVQAIDNGVPVLADVCTIKVIIEDINDNQPVFDKVAYKEFMSQDLRIDREVMRTSATDIDDGNNSVISYKLEAQNPDDERYFRIDASTGVIFLNKTVDRSPGYKFLLEATAKDHGESPSQTTIGIEITVVSSNKKAPSFTRRPEPIYIPENYSSFGEPIAHLTASSNIDNQPDLLFQLESGRTEQTNKQNTFILESSGDKAFIKLGKALDYEAVTEYTLTIRVQNKDALAAVTTIAIKVEDVNDNIPGFTELLSGSVPENEPVGTPVMQVRAIDMDGTSANNQVTYELDDHQDLFAIDRYTGNITTLSEFDREEKSVYNVKVIATDNSPSSLYPTGQHNRGEQTFRIEISDKNDNKPIFTQSVYVAEAIPENANKHSLVTEVKALDNDTASPVTYSIIDGNIGDAFKIEETTGKIRVNNSLDYESIKEYTLTVRAFDGARGDECKVEIKISNVNDCPPELDNFKDNVVIDEEKVYLDCIAKFEGYDPDIGDKTVDQHIVFTLQNHKDYFSINNDGCLKVIKPLDRDPPNTPERQLIIILADDDSSPNGLTQTYLFTVFLDDINDNAPVLDMHQPVVWDENKAPGKITVLTAKDIDSEKNGPPFEFRIYDYASDEIKSKFKIENDAIFASVRFDREEKKFYDVQIAITDSGNPQQTGVSILRVVIGDVNDNPMKAGSSKIFVYNYKGETANVEIGRIYVDDPDDWDLPDKYFAWLDNSHPLFDLNRDTGMITMLSGVSDGKYLLNFEVTEENEFIPRHSVTATVEVTVKEIPEEAVDKSGSIRFYGITAEEFVEIQDEKISKKDVLREYLAKIVNASIENVDVFTVLHSSVAKNDSLLDVRFSAHGSPYYQAEKLNAITTKYQKNLEDELGIKMLMINIDECIADNAYCNDSCVNRLTKSDKPYAVYTNRTSFVGVRAEVTPKCECSWPSLNFCLNNGTLLPNNTCDCPQGYAGPNCELLSIAFNGDGWAMYPPIDSCAKLSIRVDVRPYRANGLVFYLGPLAYNPLFPIQDFMALQIEDGFPVLLIDYGSGTLEVKHKYIKVTDGKMHTIEINLDPTNVDLIVDNCKTSTCWAGGNPVGRNKYLNVNAPLQLGGSSVSLAPLAAALNWTQKPIDAGFAGCISNLVINDIKTYNLGSPSYSLHAQPRCYESLESAQVSLGIDSNFLVALFICFALLLILLLAVVVHKRRQDPWHDKDMDDIRENIIDYEDEGGGEVDASYNLSVLQLLNNDATLMKDPLQQKTPNGDVPDISGFLDTKKEVVDKDPEASPYDDVRQYSYEGDGTTSGSLSSLASCTDEGDLKFNYLSNFGPRFHKLADMCGETPSDNESREGGEESWC